MSPGAFARYARCYDLLYRDKDYAAEAAWVDAALRSNGQARGSLLDVGCGTGRHAREFAAWGWQVTGVDVSADMIALARERTPPGLRVSYATGRAAEFDLGRQFSAVVSLFHVASYHTAPGELAAMLANLRRHLVPGGRLLFDFWHGPGVLADPPTRRERSVADEVIRVHRQSLPTHLPEENTVEVRYEVTIEPVAGGPAEQVEEVHRMRYFSQPELEPLLVHAGFRVDAAYAGLTSTALDDKAWYGLILATAV
jgi:SAM-dependent methyltransferase